MIRTGLRIIIVFAIIALLTVLVFGLYLSAGKRPLPIHRVSSFSEAFDYTNGSYQDYVAWSERRLRASRLDSPSAQTLANLLPFELEPDIDCPRNADGKVRNGIVLVHGLIASPYSMKAIGEYFQSRCFAVFAILMHGHGSRVGDMLQSGWEDWLQDLQFATRLMTEKAEQVTLSGHSVGATLAVLEAARNPAVDSLVLFAPAMQLDEASKYAGAVSALGTLFPAGAWFELEPEDAIYRYESFPFKSAAETWDLIKATQSAIAENPLAIPVFTAASAQDTTVIAQATLDFMQALETPGSFMLLYSQFDLPPYQRTQIVNSNLPEQGIVSLGHLGLMTPPTHPHYGLNGNYRYCGQYFGEDNDNFSRCKAGQRDFYGEATDANRARGLIERIAFNPFYDEMLEELDLFIQQINLDQRGIPIQQATPVTIPLELD